MIPCALACNPSLVGKYVFPQIVWESVVPKILLTFDDAPHPGTTPLLLKQLNALNIRAVFFCIGKNAEKHPGLMNEIMAEEHVIANHSYSHVNMRKLSRAEQAIEIIRAEEVFAKTTGSKTTLFRPPYGKFSRSLMQTVQNTGYSMMLWSLIPYDYKNDLTVFNKSLKYLRNNAIVVLHDNPKCASLEEVSATILHDEVLRKNFMIGRPAECLR